MQERALNGEAADANAQDQDAHMLDAGISQHALEVALAHHEEPGHGHGEKADQKQQPRVLEQWNIDKDTLRRLARKDIFGWGYTLFLPWQTYRQEISHVYMHVAFIPDSGASPVYAPMAIVSLGNEGRVPIVQSRVPAAAVTERK